MSKVKCNCAYCNAEILKTQSEINKSKTGNVFCNKSCACSFNNSHFRSNENNPNWKGGTYKASNYARKAFRYYKHECSICKYDKFPALEVHHINEDRSNDDCNNLIILCANCHRLIHYGDLKIDDKHLNNVITE